MHQMPYEQPLSILADVDQAASPLWCRHPNCYVMALCNMCMHRCIQKVIPFRTDAYIDVLVSKLAEEGVRYPRELVQSTKTAVETKLSNHQSFKMGEVNDCLTVWSVVHRSVKFEADVKQASRKRPHHYLSLIHI